MAKTDFQDEITFAQQNGLSTDNRSVAQIVGRKDLNFELSDLSAKEQKILRKSWKEEFKSQNPKGDADKAWKLGVEDCKNVRENGDFDDSLPVKDTAKVYTQEELRAEQAKADAANKAAQEQNTAGGDIYSNAVNNIANADWSPKELTPEEKAKQARIEERKATLEPHYKNTVTLGEDGAYHGVKTLNSDAVEAARLEASRLGIAFQPPPDAAGIDALKNSIAEGINNMKPPSPNDSKVAYVGNANLLDRAGQAVYEKVTRSGRVTLTEEEFNKGKKDSIELYQGLVDKKYEFSKAAYNTLNSILLDPNRDDADKKAAYVQYQTQTYWPSMERTATRAQNELKSIALNVYDKEDMKDPNKVSLYTAKPENEIKVAEYVFGRGPKDSQYASNGNKQVNDQQFAAMVDKELRLDGVGNIDMKTLYQNEPPLATPNAKGFSKGVGGIGAFS